MGVCRRNRMSQICNFLSAYVAEGAEDATAAVADPEMEDAGATVADPEAEDATEVTG